MDTPRLRCFRKLGPLLPRYLRLDMCPVSGRGPGVQPKIERRLKGGIDRGHEPAGKRVLRECASTQVEVVRADADVLSALRKRVVNLQCAVPALDLYLIRSTALEPGDVFATGQTRHGNGRRILEDILFGTA